MEAIDLTKSDSDEEVRPLKRQRRSASDDEVEVVEKPATPPPAVTGPESALGDEDLLITRATGSVWNQDLPHSRTQCGRHPFAPSKNSNNREHCDKCFCYVCDVEADKCQLWGTGHSSKDHCNAHGGRSLYRDMRSAARQPVAGPANPPPASQAAGPSGSAAGAQGRLNTPATAARSLGGGAAAVRRPGCVPAARVPAPPPVAARTAVAPAVPPQHLPAPEFQGLDTAQDDSDSSGGSADDCDHHYGGYGGYDSDEDGGSDADHDSYLLEYDSEAPCDSEGELRYVARPVPADVQPSVKVPMQPLAPAMILPDPVQNANLIVLGTIHLPIKAKAPYALADLQERLVPTGIALKLNEEHRFAQDHKGRLTISNIKYSNIVEVLPLPMLEHGCERTPMRVRCVTIVSHDGCAKPLMIGVSVHKGARLSELLAAVRQHPAAACSAQEDLVLGCCTGEQNSFLKTFLVHDLSAETNEYQAKKGYTAYRVPQAKPEQSYKLPVRVMVYNKIHSADDPWYDERADTAHPLLLDLPGALWKGGHDADKHVAGKVVAALAAYRKPGVPSRALNRCFTLQRCCKNGEPSHRTKTFTKFCKAVESSQYVAESIRNGVLYLAAHWKPSGLEVYDTLSWSRPDVHDSASKQAMAETELLIKEEEARSNAMRARAKLPDDLLMELSEACGNYPADQLKLAYKACRKPPIAACKLAILPDEEASKDCATLAIQVFVWKHRGVFNRRFFRALEDPLPVNKDIWDCSEECLPTVMEYLLRDNPLAQAMREELKACADKMRNSRPYSVTALMKWLQAGERPEAPQPPGLTVQLHPYQRQSLRFMLDNEIGEGGHRRHFWVPYNTPSGFTFWWSPVFQRPCKEVAPCPWGGFLAEEMGCGKTVEVLALILANPAPPEVVSGTVTPDGLIQSRATLVVCAVSLVGQWMEEAKSKLNGSLRMYQYHGQGRKRDPQKLATDYDLVVTTYQTLGSDWRMYTKKDGNTDGMFKPLGQIKWHRVVLDESHTVKAGGAQQSLACCALKGDRRWCCSGTPISTEVSEFMGQFNFLGCPPFNSKTYFQQLVKPFWAAGLYESPGGALNLVYALSHMAIRHTQQQRLGGQTVCKLPEKTEETIAVAFSAPERDVYMRVHNDAKAEFEKHSQRGAQFVAKHLLAIMSLLNPLRAICSGGVLREKDVKVPTLDQEEQEEPGEVDPYLMAPYEECSICLNADMERPCRTPCHHWFCKECITAELAVRDRCPLCRKQIDMAQLTEGVSAPRDDDEEMEGGAASSSAGTAVVSESKLRVLLDELAAMRQRDPSAKALIFTQFSNTLEWLMSRLTQEGYGYRTISGSMPLKKRSQAIEAFQRDPPTTVFLLSMRSGAVGINLTAANHVFILEPAMNPALEDQAVGRAFRMGQTRPVVVKKLYIKGSVEERIMELVKNRREGRATGEAGAAGMDLDAGEYEERMRKGKMKQQDMAGAIKMDRQNLRLAELQLLFRDPILPNAAAENRAAAAYNAAPAPAACGGAV